MSKDRRKFCVYATRGAGFGSQINNLLYFLYYCKINNLKFCMLRPNFIISNDWLGRASLEWGYFFPYMDRFRNICPECNAAFHFSFPGNLKDAAKIALNGFFKLIHNTKYIFWFKNANSRKHPIFLTERAKEMIKDDWLSVRRFCYIKRAENRKEFYLSIGEILCEFWQFDNEIYEKVEAKLDDFNDKICNEPYVAIHVRRGDKLKSEDRMYEADEYISALLNLDKYKKIRNVFVMTDDFAAYSEIKKMLTDKQVFSAVTELQNGYDQNSFCSLSEEEKQRKFVDFVVDVEIAKNSVFFVGSFKSNIFRLIHYFKRGDNCLDVSGALADAEKNTGSL